MYRLLNAGHCNSCRIIAGFLTRIISEFGETSRHPFARLLASVKRNWKETAMTGVTNQRDAEQVYRLWDDALGKKDLEASLSLYTDDASIESPLVAHLMKTNQGIVRGKDDLRRFIALVFQTNPPQRKRFRKGFFTDGRIITWEYPRETPDGDQMELVEVMELEAGLIRRHRVYWGWYALNVLKGG
jgi:hypothetical protein